MKPFEVLVIFIIIQVLSICNIYGDDYTPPPCTEDQIQENINRYKKIEEKRTKNTHDDVQNAYLFDEKDKENIIRFVAWADNDLFNFIALEDVKKVKELLQSGTDPNMVQTLITDIDRNIPDYFDWEPGRKVNLYPLKIAVMIGDLEIVKLLVSFGAKLPEETDEVKDFYFYALYSRSAGLLEYLFKHTDQKYRDDFFDDNSYSYYGRLLETQVRGIVGAERVDILKVLFKYGVKWYTWVIRTAVYQNAAETFYYVYSTYKNKIDLNDIMCTVCYLENWELFEFLLKEGINFDPESKYKYQQIETPIMCAAFRGQYDMVKRMIELGADVNKVNRKPLRLVVRKEHTALYYAVEGDFYCVVKLLLENGADPNNVVENPLIPAIQHKKLDMIKLLLHYGAEINRCSLTSYVHPTTPLAVAIGTGSLELVELLVDKGADVNLPCSSLRSALHTAVFCAKNGDLRILKFLIEKGADLNAQGKYCEYALTPLMTAIKLGRIEAAKYLIQAGSDLSLKECKGKKAIDYAREKGYDEIVALIEQAGNK
jgi:ankyrin repeat protein